MSDLINTFRITNLKLKGLGSYLHGNSIDIRPITILCGTNGSGKSTWFEAFRVLQLSLEQKKTPFRFASEIRSTNYYFTNSYLAHPNDEKGIPKSEGDENEYGINGSFSISMHLNTDYIDESGEIKNTLFNNNSLIGKFVNNGTISKDTKAILRLSGAECESLDNYSYGYGFSLQLDNEKITFFCQDLATDLFIEISQKSLKDDNTADFSRFSAGKIYRDESKGYMLKSESKLTSEIFDLLLQRVNTLIEEILRGFYHISAIREQCEAGSIDDEDPSKSFCPQIRYVGNKGQFTQMLRTQYFLNRMGDIPFDIYYSYWLDKLLDVYSTLDYSAWDSKRGFESHLAKASNSFLSSFSPKDWTEDDKRFYDDTADWYCKYVNCFFKPLSLPGIPSNFSSGFHQIAPMIMQLGLMKKYEVCAIENPEVHLHPELQLKIMEYFIEQAKSGRIIIIETHSDLLIRRLLRAILEEDIPQEWARIYFSNITKDSNDIFSSAVKQIKINNMGKITNWPAGFMDTNVVEARRLLDIMYGDVKDNE